MTLNRNCVNSLLFKIVKVSISWRIIATRFEFQTEFITSVRIVSLVSFFVCYLNQILAMIYRHQKCNANKRPCQRFNTSYHAFVVVIVVLHTCDLIANKESSIFNGMKTWNKVMKKSSTSMSKACTRGALPKCLFTWRCLDEPVIILSDYRICLQLVAYLFKMKKVRWAVNHWHWHQYD